MEMRKDYRRVMTIEIMCDDEKGYDEITPFLSAMKKIHEDSVTVGFMNRFDKNERIVLNGLWEKIKEDAEPVIEKNNQGFSQGTQPTRI